MLNRKHNTYSRHGLGGEGRKLLRLLAAQIARGLQKWRRTTKHYHYKYQYTPYVEIHHTESCIEKRPAAETTPNIEKLRLACL